MKKNNTMTIKKVSAMMAVVMSLSTFGGIAASAESYDPATEINTAIVSEDAQTPEAVEGIGDIADFDGVEETEAVEEATVDCFATSVDSAAPAVNKDVQTTYYQADNGRLVVVTKKKDTSGSSGNFNASVDTSAKYYPGAVVTARGIEENNAGVITELERTNCIMTVKQGNNSASVEFDPSSNANYEAALQAALAKLPEATPTANFHADYTYATSEEDIKASLNVSSDIIKKLDINFESVMQGKSQTCIVSYVQNDFNVRINTMKNTQPFTDADKAQAMIDSRDLDDQAAIINTASYGRRVYVAYTTNDTSFDLKAALKGEYGKVSGEAHGEYSEKLSNVSCTVYVNGGDMNEYKELKDAEKNKSYGDVMNILKETGNKSDFEHSEFLSYTASALSDGRNVASNNADTRYTTNITYKDQIPVNFTTAKSSVNGRINDFHVNIKYDIVVPADSDEAKIAKRNNPGSVKEDEDGMVRISKTASSKITESEITNTIYIPASVDTSSIKIAVGVEQWRPLLSNVEHSVIDYNFSDHPTSTVGSIDINCDAGSEWRPLPLVYAKADILVNGAKADSNTWRQ